MVFLNSRPCEGYRVFHFCEKDLTGRWRSATKSVSDISDHGLKGRFESIVPTDMSQFCAKFCFALV